MNLPTEQSQQQVEQIAESDSDPSEANADEVLQAILDGPPSEVRAVIQRAIHSGPVPSAGELQRYEDVLPGLANRLVNLAEKEQGIRGRDTAHFNWNVTLKVLASVVVSLAMVLGGVYCAAIGQPEVGGVIATSGVIAGVVQSFLRRSSKKDEDDNG
ncbi:DUF2335 domain-containing protein [Paracoccus lutimaris]|uniref:DUF2335 domain-containing protein n=1 Tax=Paracoccus lutimaris TaxID=1490030 RepID=UPI000DF45383|nr:DUF2335 domain-containing protein [Paracoccus lutimaris]